MSAPAVETIGDPSPSTRESADVARGWSLAGLLSRDRFRAVNPRFLALAVGLGILAWAYWPNLEHLWTIWQGEPNYSHGMLVIPISLYIFWRRIADVKGQWATTRGAWWAWVALIAVLVARILCYENNSLWSEDATFIPAVAGLILTLGGWPLFLRGWPAVVFLIFMLPLPESIKDTLSLPLQTIATLGSVFVMQLTGLRAIADGHVINLPDALQDARTLEVALACNGLSMLMTLAATVTVTVILFPLSTLKRTVVLLSTIPIALLSNIIRIAATGWCYYLIQGRGKTIAHDWSGYFMMVLAVVLVYLEIRLVSWLTGDTGADSHEPDRPILAIITHAKTDRLNSSRDQQISNRSAPGTASTAASINEGSEASNGHAASSAPAADRNTSASTHDA